MKYTYRKLLEDLQGLSEAHLDIEVHIHDIQRDNYTKVQTLGTTDVKGGREDYETLPIMVVNSPAQEKHTNNNKSDIRLCTVTLKYADRNEDIEIYLDLNKSIEDQVFKSLNQHPYYNDYPLDDNDHHPDITSFTWSEVGYEDSPYLQTWHKPSVTL
jgi:hypothetical protein